MAKKTSSKVNNTYKDITARMLNFIDESPTCFQVIDNLKKRLVAEGYE